MINDRIQLLHGDCITLMNDIEDKSIDMILCDLPYGVLNKSNNNTKWDSVIPFKKLWEQYERIIKDNGAIVLFGQGMFTADLMESNRKLWRYNLVWDKVQKRGFLNARRMPLRQHEDICVFYKKLPTYNPQMIECEPRKKCHIKKTKHLKEEETNSCYGSYYRVYEDGMTNEMFPSSIVRFSREQSRNVLHPTQKPVSLLEWLIKTYTNENEVVLDNCCGSGSTGVACIQTNRKFIGMELDDKYYEVARERLEKIKEETINERSQQT